MTEHPDTVSDDESALDATRDYAFERSDDSTDAGRDASTWRGRR
jgi:hypothetical protein